MEGYIGDVLLWAPSFVPRNWMACEGQLLPINQHQALFSLLGTQYGGNGQTTFALPDMRDPGNPGYHKGFGPGQPVKYIICIMGIYPSRW
ncbi:MAG: phage tail protein [Candidatus Sericytochromatia bacterium]